MKKTPFEGRLDSAEIERAFLESFDDDAPPPGSKLAVMAALGAGISSAAVGGVASAAAGGASGAATGGHVAGAVKGTSAAVLKWFGVGVLGGAAVLAPRALVSRHQAVLQRTTAAPAAVDAPERTPFHVSPGVPTDRRAESAPAAVSAPLPPKTSPRDQGDERGVLRSPTPPVAALAPETPNGPRPTGESVRAPSRLAAETELLDGARRALAEGNPSAATQRLDRYEIEFPQGALHPEAIVLRVEALVKSGDRQGAAALARRSVAALPEKYAEKIRLLLSAGE